MKIVILGAGAIGSLWAVKLSYAKHLVSLWQREPVGEHQALQLNDEPIINFVTNDLASLHAADLLLVTLKAWQVQDALESIASEIKAHTMILLMHNGMGVAELVKNSFNSNPLLVATTSHGAYKPNKEQVIHTGVGQTYIGSFNLLGGECEFLARQLDNALKSVDWQKNIISSLWVKLAINCAINPLTAIYQCRNGQLADDSFILTIKEICHEIIAINHMQAKLEPNLQRLEFASLYDQVMQVIKNTANNYSSMRQDIFFKRRSEIDFINGYLLKLAAKHQISLLHNELVFNQIKEIERSYVCLN